MAGWYLSERACKAVRDARGMARALQHTALGPPHLLAAILQQWDDQHAGGPALLRACGLTADQATDLTARLVAAYDHPEAATPAVPVAGPRPNPALRFLLAHAHRIAAQARAPYVGTEHLVLAALWLDYGGGLRRQGIGYQQAAEQLATLPRTERTVEDLAIEPLEAVAVPTPAAAALAELARQQAEQHPIEGDGRVSTLHHLLALLMHGGAGRLLGELGVSYNAVVERLAADGAGLIEADDQRPDEEPLPTSTASTSRVRARWPLAVRGYLSNPYPPGESWRARLSLSPPMRRSRRSCTCRTSGADDGAGALGGAARRSESQTS
jgi:ATP-dependent Clp protease ATP-binding subunit ClpA